MTDNIFKTLVNPEPQAIQTASPASECVAQAGVVDGGFECETIDIFTLKNINLRLGNYQIFKDFNLEIKDFKGQGQFISIMGASGCGKSTILKMLAGLLKPDSGEILFYGKPLSELTTIPMIFQQYSSFEWMTVLDNVALPMIMRGVPKKEAHEQAMKLIELVGLSGQELKWAKMPPLSGGQLQRVAIARGLATQSQIMLLDEYSSGLDIVTKHSMQDTLLKIFYGFENDPTFINVGHDISECVYLSDRIYILDANPCRIHSVIDIDFTQRERTSELRQTERFNRYVSHIEKIMQEISQK